jgi:hypothetical protein
MIDAVLGDGCMMELRRGGVTAVGVGTGFPILLKRRYYLCSRMV